MNGYLNGLSFLASGNISPATFVIFNTAANGSVTQAGAGGNIFGVAQNWGNGPNLTGATGYAATVGQPLVVYTAASIAKITLGGTSAVGDKLKSSSTGTALTTTTSGDIYGGICLEAGVSGDQVDMFVFIDTVH